MKVPRNVDKVGEVVGDRWMLVDVGLCEYVRVCAERVRITNFFSSFMKMVVIRFVGEFYKLFYTCNNHMCVIRSNLPFHLSLYHKCVYMLERDQIRMFEKKQSNNCS